MKIILDSNIFVEDFLMKSIKFSNLFDFLKKTNSEIVIFQIVFQEVIALYRRKLIEKLDKYYKSKEELLKIFNNKPFENQDINIDNQVKIYETFFRDKFNLSKHNLTRYKDNYLGEIVTRAIVHKKPFSKSGKGFRDTLIWLTLLDFIKNSKLNQFVFISNDTNAFGNNNQLHTSLGEELESKIEVAYYNTIDSFIRDHGSEISFITKEWINSEINKENFVNDLEEDIQFYLNEYETDECIKKNWIEEGYIVNKFNVKLIQFTNFSDNKTLSNFYVYKKSDGTFYVETNNHFEAEIEIVYYKTNYSSIELGENDFKSKIVYEEIEFVLGFNVKNSKISEMEILSAFI